MTKMGCQKSVKKMTKNLSKKSVKKGGSKNGSKNDKFGGPKTPFFRGGSKNRGSKTPFFRGGSEKSIFWGVILPLVKAKIGSKKGGVQKSTPRGVLGKSDFY